MRFSDRIGTTQPPVGLQLDEMSRELRNSLWNLLVWLYQGHWVLESGDYWGKVATRIAIDFRKSPVDELPFEDDGIRDWIKGYFFQLPWWDAYNFIEFIVDN